MDKTVTLNACAKINPYLRIVGVRGDLHLIDTVIAPLPMLFDVVTVTARDDEKITLEMEPDEFQIPLVKNVAYRTARALQRHFGTPGMDIFIKKNIPYGAGFGGSSADGAAIARAMATLFNLEIRPAMLVKLGSDMPAMFYGEAVRVRGIGEKLTPVEVRLPGYMVAIVHYEQINSGEAYKLYDSAGGAGAPPLRLTVKNEFPFIEEYCVNDLSVASEMILPDIAFARELLLDAGAKFTFVTGSGSAIIGVFSKNTVEAALEIIEEAEKIVGERKFYSLKLF